MYDGIKKSIGPTRKKTAPLKSTTGELIQDRAKQMECWVQHYSEPYSRENVITEEALNAIKCLAMLEELECDPTLEALNPGLDSLASDKIPSKESIPAEVLKCYKRNIIS